MRLNTLPSRRNRQRPTLETLEGRQLLALGSEISALVNSTTRNAQFESVNASSSNGSSVAVWTDTYSSTDRDIRAQRFDAYGNKSGPEIVISNSSLDERTPAVAMDGFGNFVVAWQQRQTNGDTNVVAKRFNAAGAPLGSVVQVGAGTFREHDPSVAMDDYGNFVVAYTRDTNNNNPDVFAKRYNFANQLVNVIDVAVSSTAEDNAKIAMTPDGRFNVVWEQTYSVNDHDIYMKRYAASGALLGTNAIDVSTSFESRPSISMDDYGNAVVAWQRTTYGNADVLARRVNSSGSVGGITTIAATSFWESSPSVALKRTGGAYVVAFTGDVAAGSHVLVAEVSAADHVTTYDAGARMSPSVSFNGAGYYQITYTSNDNGDLNIRRRRGIL